MAKQLQLTNQDHDDLTFQEAPKKLNQVLHAASCHYKVSKRQIFLSYFNLDMFKFVNIDQDEDYQRWLKEKSSSIAIAVQLPGQIPKFTIPKPYRGGYMDILVIGKDSGSDPESIPESTPSLPPTPKKADITPPTEIHSPIRAPAPPVGPKKLTDKAKNLIKNFRKASPEPKQDAPKELEILIPQTEGSEKSDKPQKPPERKQDKSKPGQKQSKKNPKEDKKSKPSKKQPEAKNPTEPSHELLSLPSEKSLGFEAFDHIQLLEWATSKGSEQTIKRMSPSPALFSPIETKPSELILSQGDETYKEKKSVRVKEAMCLLESIGYEELDLGFAKNVLRKAYPGNDPKIILAACYRTKYIETEKGVSVKLMKKSEQKLKSDQQEAIIMTALELFTFVEDDVATFDSSEANYEFVQKVVQNPDLKIESEIWLDLLFQLGEYKYHMLGIPESAVENLEEAVELASTLYPDLISHKLATAHENLAKCYIPTSQLSKSELHVRKSLEIKVHLYGDNHPETAQAFHYMGNVALAQNKVEEAIEYHEKAAQMRSDTIGSDSAEVSYSLDMLAQDYIELKNLEHAYKLQIQAKDIRKAKLPPESPKLAEIYFKLSSTWLAMRDLEKAEKYIARSFQIRLYVFGDSHHTLAACRVNMAQLYILQERYKEAMIQIQLAIKIYLDRLGGEHRQTKAALMVKRRLEKKYEELGITKDYIQFVEPVGRRKSACCTIF